jgi:enoyl-CoA hydratase
MSTLTSYDLTDGIAEITLDDGKVNVMSLAMQQAIHDALDRAQSDALAVVLVGREGVLSAGFDLSVLTSGGAEALAMVMGGFELSRRLLAFPRPVIIGCPGHAIAMGAFLLLSGDYRVGARGPYKLVANEVAIGLTMPHAALAILRQRLTPAALNRAATLAEPCSPDDAVPAGYLDQVVDADELLPTARRQAIRAAALDLGAHAATKRRLRARLLDDLDVAIAADRVDLREQVGAGSPA